MDKDMEQMVRRQSAPRPSNQQALAEPNDVNTYIDKPIGKEAIRTAVATLQKYKEGKANLERRIIENDKWYKLRHWECMRGDNADDVKPTSAWLFNCIANKHADAMDNFPAPNVLPREEGDKFEAEMLTSIIPVILDQNNIEGTYDDVVNKWLTSGTGVFATLWDSSKLNGLGDISIEKIDLLSLFWESGITDIQRSKNLFSVELADNDVLIGKYPQLAGKLTTPTIDVAKYSYDDSVDTTNKSVVVDWYYKKTNSQGKTVLHYCKFVNEEILFATENEPEYKERGFYDHGRYPFTFVNLFKLEGTPCGFGYIDVGKSAQEYIDRGNQSIMENMLANTKPRHFVRDDGAVNEAEYADLTRPFVHVKGNLSNDSIMPIIGKPLNDIYVAVINNKVDELKETTGNRDISTGGTTSGVTAASAIAAMQEAGSKLSRDANKAMYRAFKAVCLDVIELIRQFYTLPRCFRIMGQNGVAKFVNYSNAGILPQEQPSLFGEQMGTRLPLFDVEITAQKQSPYSKMAQNEMALQFYASGFFNPQLADQALACLDMMDFDRKDFVVQKISQNGTMYQQMMQMQAQMMQLGAIVDADRGSNEVTQSLASQFGMQMQGMPNGFVADAQSNEALGGKSAESAVTESARKRVAESTSPT